jgi:hypothetical protein
MGTDTSSPFGPAPLRTWSLSIPTTAITFPWKRCTISAGISFLVLVHQTWPKKPLLVRLETLLCRD